MSVTTEGLVMVILDEPGVRGLVSFVDQNVQARGCDHSHRFAIDWASQQGIDWPELRDALDDQGAFCDCEIVLNLGDGPLHTSPRSAPVDSSNRWMLPPAYIPGSGGTAHKIIVSRIGIAKSMHTKDGEWLVPAPIDAKPRKRVRKLVHFFIGVESGLPSEVGVVTEIEPMSISRYAHIIARSPVPELKGFGRNEADFILGKVANLASGTTVGTDIADRVGFGSKHQELAVHRVIVRRS